ncbi:MAG: cobyrinate a,c-diamide synthase [Austwickia sp.]|nr:cobyrinate a,c-diamide synthase [Austwickia sp.]MBK8437868.1 cobyrinate a,c-diamide synthase [Austwickia sp.]MBK9100169.1 cobyrinate a,c-diamide synthase [Austwickia sp.]
MVSAAAAQPGPGRRRLPRLVVAAPASGHGKTTVAVGLMAALRARGLAVAPGKVGPDYIDPGYHALATGRPGRNLDPYLCSPALIVPLLWHAADHPTPADLTVIEGVMGLYDGRLGTQGFASTAHVARLTESPILLVVDARHTSRSVGALVHGMATYEPGITIAGVVLNQVASPRQRKEAVAAIEPTGVPVLGTLPRNAGIEAPSRHLGLVPAAERPQAVAALETLAAAIAEHLDLDAVLRLAADAPDLVGAPWDPRHALGEAARAEAPTGPIVAVAGGRAFTFGYPETEELLHAAGCRTVVIDPLTDTALPAGTAGLYLGGGFPQVYAAELAGNASLREAVRAAAADGMPVVAECAGLLYLARSLDGAPMSGVVPSEAAMTPRLTMGYREFLAPADTLLAAAGEHVRGHEFHRTDLAAKASTPAWCAPDGPGHGWSLDPAGTGSPTVHASYLHVHWAGHTSMAARFARAVHRYAGPPDKPDKPDEHVDLHHHGDADLVPGAVDLAVNVRGAAPPWLTAAVIGDGDWSAYPDPRAAVAAIADRHAVAPTMVLPTAGAAEAFTLLARAWNGTHPVVVHPQFTEPEAALRQAGHRPGRHLLTDEGGFVLEPSAVPDPADLVIIGNPTNPTGVLHPAESLHALRRPGRVVVVDEAFLDLVPGEPETLIGPQMTGVLVIRSLTKTWGVAGLRAGYVVGDPELVARLAAQQPPWSVSTPAARLIAAALRPHAQREASALARQVETDRDDLTARLHALGLRTVEPARTPFVLVDTSPFGPHSIWTPLAAHGFAVRRGETFPGLSPTWIRVAVRDPETHRGFAQALERLDRPAHTASAPPPRAATVLPEGAPCRPPS